MLFVEVAAVYVDRTCENARWVCGRVDYVFTERNSFSGSECVCPGSFDMALRIILDASLEDVVLASSVNANDGPHVMIVRHDRHTRRPNGIDDREVM